MGKKTEQKYVVVIASDSTPLRLIGTRAGGAFTRNGAWLAEKYFSETVSNARVTTYKLEPYKEESDEQN